MNTQQRKICLSRSVIRFLYAVAQRVHLSLLEIPDYISMVDIPEIHCRAQYQVKGARLLIL
jgi:hypothetical protein